MTHPFIIASPADATLTPVGVAPPQVTVEVEFRLGDHAAALAHQAIEAGE